MSNKRYKELEIAYNKAEIELINEPDGHCYTIIVKNHKIVSKYTYINEYVAECNYRAFCEIDHITVNLFTDNIHHRISGDVEYLPKFKLKLL